MGQNTKERYEFIARQDTYKESCQDFFYYFNENDSNDKDETEQDCIIDTSPIFIENMNKAQHTNMETLADGDMVQTFRQNMRFKIENDHANKRVN